jgi:hypothetical protein
VCGHAVADEFVAFGEEEELSRGRSIGLHAPPSWRAWYHPFHSLRLRIILWNLLWFRTLETR